MTKLWKNVFITHVRSLPPASAVEVIELVPCFRLPVFLSFCLSVSQHSQSHTVWHTDTKLGTGIDLDKISAKFDGQGHRSKLNVAKSKTWFSRFFSFEWPDTEPWPMMWCHDVMWRHNVTWCHWMMTVNDICWTKALWNARRGRCVNTGVFLFLYHAHQLMHVGKYCGFCSWQGLEYYSIITVV